jgi:hypothetical protein
MTMATGGAFAAVATEGSSEAGVVRTRAHRVRTAAPALPPPNAPLPALPPSTAHRQPFRPFISLDTRANWTSEEEELLGPDFTAKLLKALSTPPVDSPAVVKAAYPWTVDQEVKEI